MLSLYLDSSDYSNFTNTKLLDREPVLRETLAYIRAAVANKKIRVFFSSAHVSEMLPLNSESVFVAKQKLALLRELCGYNALQSIVDVGKAEVRALNAGGLPPASIVDPRGRWLPTLDFSMSDCTTKANQKLRERGASRELKRKALPDLVRMYRESNATKIAELLSSGQITCPPGLEKQFIDAARERITWPQLTNSYYDAFNDFDGLASSIDSAPDFAARLRKIVRAASESNGRASRAMAERVSLLPETEEEKRAGWRKWEELIVREIVATHFEKSGIVPAREFTFEEIKTACPGIYSMVITDWRFLAQAFFGGNQKGLTDSVYADTLHAMYAPYVDVFRADSEMADHVRAAVSGRGTSVVGKLKRLVEELESRLAR